MASRMKEDERNEKIIRGLLKLPANRRCINCNNLGPQYVCTSFGTFICTNCSGLHREFCHRVKSISMAKFTTQEVNALQNGGNEKAREIYFKEWDQQRNSLPDGSNIDRLRDFIKHVYVDRRFTGEKNTGRPLEGKADMNYSSDSGKGDSYRGGSRSPPYDDHYNERVGTGGNSGDRNFRYAYGERSPGYDQSDNKRSPRQFEVVDDRARDDRYGNGNQFRRFEERRLPDALPKPEGSSPSRQKDISSPPIVRPVRDILGDDAPKLFVGGPPKTNITMVTDSSPQIQSASSSSSMGSGDGNSTQSKKVDLGSLIDFNADPEPPVTSSPQKPVPQQTTTTPSNGGEWASFDTTSQQKAPPAASSTVTLESALSQLAAPGPILSTNDGGQWPATQQRQTNLFPSNPSTPANPPFNAPVVGSQPWGSSAVPSVQGPLPNSAGHLPQGPNKPPQEPSPVISSPLPTVVKPIGRQELPADLFAALYPSAPVYPGWQRGPHPGYGFGMQYPMGMVHPQTMPTYPSYGQVTQPSKSANPFDVGGEATLSQAPKFPSMGSLQGALPNVSGPSPILRSSSLGNLTPQWGPTQQASYPPAMAQGQYLGQQMPSNMHQLPHSNAVMMGHQGTGSPRSVGSGYGNLGMDPSSTARYPRPGTPNSFSMLGGNPFG